MNMAYHTRIWVITHEYGTSHMGTWYWVIESRSTFEVNGQLRPTTRVCIACISVCTCIHVCQNVYTYMHICIHTHKHAHTHTHIYTHTHTHTHTHTYKITNTHTHTHTHTHAHMTQPPAGSADISIPWNTKSQRVTVNSYL